MFTIMHTPFLFSFAIENMWLVLFEGSGQNDNPEWQLHIYFETVEGFN